MNFKKLKISLISQFISQSIKVIITLFIGSLTVRYLGPEGVGKLSYSIALIGILAPFGALGIRGSLSSLLCEIEDNKDLVITAFYLKLIGSFAIGLILIPIFFFETDIQLKNLYICVFFANLFNAGEVFEIKLLNNNEGQKVALTTLIQNIAFAISSLLLVYFKAPLSLFGIVYAFQFFLRALFNTYFANLYKYSKKFLTPNLRKAKELLKRGWPLVFTGFTVMIYTKSDQIMLSFLGANMSEIGQYSIAVRIIGALYFIPVVISKTYLPFVGKESSHFSKNKVLKKLYRISWISGLGLTFICLFIFPKLVAPIFGRQYLESEIILSILSPSLFAINLGCANSTWLNTNNFQKQILLKSIIGAVSNILLNFILIPKFGLVGASVSTLIGIYLSVFGIIFSNKKIRLNIVKLVYPFQT